MKIDIGLTERQRSAVGRILNTLLADEFLLYNKTRRFHWNVEGPHFSELHKFFESQYEQLDEVIDEVAERARALDIMAAATLREYLSSTRLKENPAKTEQDMLKALLNDHQAIVRSLRDDLVTCAEQLGDAGTSDFLTGLMEQHEKMAWMLRSYLR